MSFLKAEWRKLVLANYVVDPDLLSRYLPPGTELDFWNGNCYVSLVGFMFVNTKLLGMKIPFHSNFEEVNLRFYVKRFDGTNWKRGVVFIKEIVPRVAISFIANTVYKEHYETLAMRHLWEENAQSQIVQYQWKKAGKWNQIKVQAKLEAEAIGLNSETEFITEHYWGYAKVDELHSNEYEVTHPKWQAYPILDYKIEVDFQACYGQEFKFLKQQEPFSVMLAEGSEITVENKLRISLD